MHTAGEPVRILIADNLLPNRMSTIDARRYFRDQYDDIRKLLMLEPRGHSDMYGALILQSPTDDADISAIFIHNSGYSTMCGHATIALGRWLYDHGAPASSAYTICCPCGPVSVTVEEKTNGIVQSAFTSVRCYVEAQDLAVNLDGVGNVQIDIAYGGAYYVIAECANLGLDFESSSVGEMRAVAMQLTNQLRKDYRISSPVHDDLAFLYGTIITDGKLGKGSETSRNLCVFAEGQIDRSPTGSGVSARVALDVSKGRLVKGDDCRYAGLSGVSFSTRVVDVANDGVAVKVMGEGFYTAESELIVESGDALRLGFSAQTFSEEKTG